MTTRSAKSKKLSGATAGTVVGYMCKLVSQFCLGMLVLGLAGCELGDTLSDVANQLSNPELERLGPGRKVMAGSYRNLSFDGSAADGAYVVALRDDNALVIVPFNDGAGCDVGPVQGFQDALLRTEDDQAKFDARIPFEAQTESDGKILRFSDFECHVDKLEVPGGALPLSTSFAKVKGFIVQDAKDQVYYVNPWDDQQQLLAKETAALVKSRQPRHAIFAAGSDGDERMWTISAGVLGIHNRALKLEQTGGEDLVSLIHSSGGRGGPMVAVQNSASDLFVAHAADISAMKKIDEDACRVVFNSGAHGRELVYFSPCAKKELVVYELETDVRRSMGAGVVDYKIVGATETGPVILYVTEPNADSPKRGTLRARWGEKTPVTLGSDAHLGLSRLKASEEAQVVVDWSDNSGTLKQGKAGQKLTAVAEGVSYFSSLGIISDFDGNNGRFSSLDSDTGELTLLAEKASIHGIRRDAATDRALFLANYDGTEGDLTLLETGETQLISHNVRPNSYQFTALLPMITVLSDLVPDEGVATLKLRYIDRDEDVIVSDGVSETLEVGWPREGMLYSVPRGDDAGIWFAEAQ